MALKKTDILRKRNLTDEQVEKVIVKLGFKPGQIFSERELWKSVEKVVGKADTEAAMDSIINRSMLVPHFKFVPKNE